MMEHDDRLTRNIAVPAWMVYALSGLLTVLSAGAIGTIVSVVNWCFLIQSDVGELKAMQAAAKIKEEDFVAALNGMRTSLTRIERDVDIIKARMP